MAGIIYRVLGGPRHGELVEMEHHQKTLTCILPTEPVVASWHTADTEELFKTRMFIYETATFSFPHAGNDVRVLVPKGSSDSMKEWYLTRFIEGGPV